MHSPTPADVQELPSEPARLLGCQEDDRVGHIGGRADAAERLYDSIACLLAA